MNNLITEKEIVDIEADIYNKYYALGGEKITSSDPLNILFKTLTYTIARQQAFIRYLSEQNFISSAIGEYLDKLGAFVGVKRKVAEASLTTIRFTRVDGSVGNILIPQGTRTTSSSKIFFSTVVPATLLDGEDSVEVVSKSIEVGSATADFPIGSIKSLVDPISFIKEVENISVSAGGRDIESDEDYRTRLLIAPESLSVAGPRNAYIAYAKNAYQGVIDVAVLTAEASAVVEVYPLMQGGVIPSDEVLKEIQNALSADDIRPLTDKVEVKPPIEVEYNINIRFYLYQNSYLTEADVVNVVDSYIASLRERLGLDIVIDDLIAMLKKVGVKRVEVLSYRFIEVAKNQVPKITEKIVQFGGLEDE